LDAQLKPPKVRRMGPVRRAINRAGPFVLAFLVTLFAIGTAWRAWGMPMYGDLENVAHAGGGIGNVSYINGLTALENSYANGFRFFEMDFLRTRDGSVVCSHDWSAFEDKVPTLAQFMDHRTAQMYPPCTVTEMIAWFYRHPDATLIADTKADVINIDKELQAKLGQQLLPQVFSIDQAEALAGGGRFPLIIALYQAKDEWNKFSLIGSLRGRRIPVWAVAMSRQDVYGGLALWAKLWVDAPVYSYTVNSCADTPWVKLLGADAIYTDYLPIHACES
jgi:glycerophosphoryl diester phosphodiesterase